MMPVPDAAVIDSQGVRIGLALSGGAALGLAHIGVLKVLEREGIHVCCVAGNSMGSLVGGLYAAGYSAAQMESIAVNADFKQLFGSSIPFGAQYLPERQRSQRYIINLSHRNFIPALPGGLIMLQNVEFLLMRLLSDIEYNTFYDFDRLPVPYRAVAVDLVSGELVVLRSGRLEQAIRASIAIPGVFAPEIVDTLVLIDGGVQRLLPVEPLLEFAPDLIIASITRKANEAETGVDLINVVSRTMDLINLSDLRTQMALADIVINPDVDPFLASDFSSARALIAAGEKATEAILPEIKEKIAQRKPVATDKKIATRPKPIIESVRFEGLRTTRAHIISNNVEIRPGVTLDFNRLIDDMVNLYNTGLFLNVNYQIVALSDTTVEVVYEVREQDYGFYGLGLKYDNTDNLLLGIAAGQSNLWGSGASVRAVVNVGNPRELRLGLNGTRFFGFPFGYRVDLFLGAIDRKYYELGEWQSDYKNEYYGGVAEVGYILGTNAFFNLGFDAQHFNYQLPDLPVFDTLPEQEWIIGPTFKLEFNSYEDLQLPTKGTALSLNMIYSSKALKAEHDFVKIDFSLERYIPISSRFLLHPGIDLGLSFGRLSWASYFLTDPDKMVGFKKEEYTTRQNLCLRLSADIKLFNLFGQQDYPFYLQLLSCVGTFTSLSEIPDLASIESHLHWGAGIGARTNTPVGPFRLTIGLSDREGQSSDDIEVNYYISIGREFRYTK